MWVVCVVGRKAQFMHAWKWLQTLEYWAGSSAIANIIQSRGCVRDAIYVCMTMTVSFKFQVLFVTYTTIQRVYNQQWNVSQVRSMDSANIVEYNTREVYINKMNKKDIKNKI